MVPSVFYQFTIHPYLNDPRTLAHANILLVLQQDETSPPIRCFGTAIAGCRLSTRCTNTSDVKLAARSILQRNGNVKAPFGSRLCARRTYIRRDSSLPTKEPAQMFAPDAFTRLDVN